MFTCCSARCWAWSMSSPARRRLRIRSARSSAASAADGIDTTNVASATGSMTLPSPWRVMPDVGGSASVSVISSPQLRASSSRLRLAIPVSSAVALSSWMIMSCSLLSLRPVQQVIDLLNPGGPADLGGGGQAVAEHVARLIKLACGHQQLAQCDAHGGDPVGSLQAAHDLKGLRQPGEGRLIVLPCEVDSGEVPASGGDPVEVSELLVDLQSLVLQLSCLVVVAVPVGDVGDLAPGDGGFPGVAEALEGGQLDFTADPQGLVVVAALVGDVGDSAPGDGGGAGVAEALEGGQLDFAVDPQGLVVVAAPVGDVGDLAPGDGGFPGVAEALEGGQLDFAVDPQGLVVVAAPVGNIGDPAPGEGGFPGVAEAREGGQLDFAVDPQGFVV